MKHIVAALFLVAGLCQAQTMPILTRSFDNTRSNLNSHERILSQASVGVKGIRLLLTIRVYGDARGIEAAPLILPKVQTARGMRDVMVLCSMANQCRGVDASDGSDIWDRTLGVPVLSTAQIDSHQINQHFGCLSTGVIDADTKQLYQVCQISTDGTGSATSGRYYMFVLKVADGSLVTSLPMQGSDSSLWKQRSSLVLTNVAGVKTVFFAHGSVYETGGGYRGYTGGITAFDLATNTISAYLPMTAGIWMAGQGLAADADGYLYAITGNGDFSPADGYYGESFVRLKYTPATAHAASLEVIDDWSPFIDRMRSGQQAVPAGKLAGESMVSEAMRPVGSAMSTVLANSKAVVNMNDQGQATVLIYPPPMASGAYADEDLGSAGGVLDTRYGFYIGGGKDSLLYVTKIANMGHTMPSDFDDAKANCRKLASMPTWGGFSPGPIDSCPQNPQTLDFLGWGKTRHFHSTPTLWFKKGFGQVMFVGGENSPVQAWKVGSDGSLTYIANTDEVASPEVQNTPGGMAGTELSMSSNGDDPASALLFGVQPFGDVNTQITGGRLVAWNPDPDSYQRRADGSLKIPVLWRSDQWGINFTANKFLPAVIDNGRVILGTYSGSVLEFGLSN